MSQALIDLKITHEDFKIVVIERDKYEEMKENIRNIRSNHELSENSRNDKKNIENTQIKKK